MPDERSLPPFEPHDDLPMLEESRDTTGDTEPIDIPANLQHLADSSAMPPAPTTPRGGTAPAPKIGDREGRDALKRTDGRPDAPPTRTSPVTPPEGAKIDPKQTLVGTGGLDPNPDFAAPPADPYQAGATLPHQVRFDHTQVHVPAQPPAQTSRRAAVTMRTPVVTAPTQPPAPPAPPVPYPPAYGQPQPRRVAAPKPRRILGCTPTCLMVFVGLFATLCGGLTLITLILTATLGAELESRLQAQVAQIDVYDNFESTFYYDRTGETLLYEQYSEGKRTNISYDEFPQDLINATVATEDDSFFVNPGFEAQATIRAFLQYVGISEGATGGSTITQQLVRNVLFDSAYRAERSIQRKVEEIMLAFLLTQRRSKQDILAMYLNEIYYGNRSYGAEAAARTFFDKSARDLTLGEAALLAGLPQAPANLDPLNPDPSVQAAVNARWRLVLERMVVRGYITPAQRDEAIAQGLVFNPPTAPLRAPHFTVYAWDDFVRTMQSIGYTTEQIDRGGFRVFTTVDLAINDMAQQVAAGQVAGLAANRVGNAAVLVLKPVTGEVLAMVGSIDYDNDSIDGRVNVTTSPRQPGSTMKAFTYAAALELGMTPADIIWDTPTTIDNYTPINYDRQFHGPLRLRQALANSYNVPAVQTLRRIGVPALLAFAQRAGINSLGMDASRFGLSLTLGGGEITLLELTRGYSIFANGGTLVPTTTILCVLDTRDRILYQYEGGCPRGVPSETTVNRAGYGTQVIDPRIAYVIGDVLSDNAARTPAMGANSPLNTGRIRSSVKTGTTDDFRDNWTVGYTRNVAVGVWVGNSSGAPMINSTGLTGAAPIWNAVMTRIYGDDRMLRRFTVNGALLPDQLDLPPGLSRRRLCNISALREPALDCGASIEEWWLDSPAAVPDENGNLQYIAPEPPAPDQPPAAGPWLRLAEPGIYRVLVRPIPPEVANSIIFASQPGQPAPPPPLYCQVPIEAVAYAPGAREQLFLAPPPVPADAVQAELYARNNGLAFLPTIACTLELLNMQVGGVGGASGYSGFISYPANGQVISGDVPIIGSAQFPTGQGQYYKIEISGGQFGGGWVTMSDVSYNNVVNGQLDILPGSRLLPGTYTIQLIIVGGDGNYALTPYAVSFVVQ